MPFMGSSSTHFDIIVNLEIVLQLLLSVLHIIIYNIKHDIVCSDSYCMHDKSEI